MFEREILQAAAAVALAFLGWFATVARYGSRIARAERDIAKLEARVATLAPLDSLRRETRALSESIDELKGTLGQMDERRETARCEITNFRERIGRELGEIRAMLTRGNG